jgi:hypothetical protein
MLGNEEYCAALATASQAKGKRLTDDEVAVIYQQFHTPTAANEPISDDQRAANKARRLGARGAEPNDGLTVRFIKTCSSGVAGETAVVLRGPALALIREGIAESAE